MHALTHSCLKLSSMCKQYSCTHPDGNTAVHAADIQLYSFTKYLVHVPRGTIYSTFMYLYLFTSVY